MIRKALLAALGLQLSLVAQAQARIDFDRDGKSDILWHNGNTGELRIWRMNGTTKLEDLGTTFQGGSSNVPNSSGWRVVGVADFNRDGIPDILWHHGPTGGSSIWYMNGAKGTNAFDFSSLTSNAADNSGWRMVGLGDFTGDGVTDVLWAHRDGLLSIWKLGGASGNQVLSTPALNVPSMPERSLSRVVGVADFNQDSRPDILWQNINTGRLTIWFMNWGTPPTIQQTLDLPTSVAGSANADSSFYRFASTEDMNGDGMPDLMWHHQVVGDTRYTKLSTGLGSLGTDTLPSSLNIGDLTGWRIVNGAPPPRAWRRGANCVPFQKNPGLGQSVTYPSGMGVQLSGQGSKVVCAIPRTTSGPNITNDILSALDVQVTIPSSQPQVQCTVNTFRTMTGPLGTQTLLGTPRSDVTVGTGSVMIHISPEARSGWWRASDWDYAQMTCELTFGNGPVTIQQYWISEDGVFQKERIYPMSVGWPASNLTSSWGFRDGTSGGFIEADTNGVDSNGGLFRWDFGRTLGTLNDKNLNVTLSYIPNFTYHASINGANGGAVDLPNASPPAPARTVTTNLNGLSDEFNIQSPGIGDIDIFSFRTF